MDQHRWQRIERLYHSALERDPEQRNSYLAQECRDDEDLRREVESLLEQQDSPAEQLLDRPAVERARNFLDETSDSGFAAGTQLGPYQLLGPLGVGGMGRVYQAHDSRLGRNVAIKISHERFSQRFTREARAIAQLSHSNICTLYDIGPNYLVMECVEGGTLEAKISAGPLPIAEAIDIAFQVAQGLRFAHAKQILHRDIKPANVMLTAEGQVKIMDFGLAKRSRGSEAEDDRTRTDELTAPGALLGTPAYMSPEQARGEQADEQSDLWALGVVMYEMVAGRRPFAAENSLALLRSILEDEPTRLTAVRPDCPAELQRIVDRALAKKRTARYASAAELLAELSPLSKGSAVAVPRRNRRLLLYAGACLAAAGIVALIVAGRSGGKPPAIRMEQITAFPDSATNPSLSADGRMLAFIRGPLTFTTPGQVYVKQLPGGDAVQLTNDATMKMHPVFSPDGSRVAYTVRTADQSWDTWEVPVLGGQPRPWLPNASGLTWIAAGPDSVLGNQAGRWNAHGARDRVHQPVGHARYLRARQCAWHGAPIPPFAGPQMGAADRDGSGMAAVPAGSVRWQIRGAAGRPSECSMHLYGVVSRRALDVLLLAGRGDISDLAAEIPGWSAGATHLRPDRGRGACGVAGRPVPDYLAGTQTAFGVAERERHRAPGFGGRKRDLSGVGRRISAVCVFT